MGSPVWARDGIIAVGNAHKDRVKLTFSNGARLPDPDKLFNAGLDGSKWRAIDLFKGGPVNPRALKDLVRAAVAYNQSKLKKKAHRPEVDVPAATRHCCPTSISDRAVFSFSRYGTPFSIHAGAAAPFRKWSKYCWRRMV